jgi:hypothetical protein
MKKVSIGGGQAMWGDINDAAIHMVHNADLNYLACDYLAELTMSIMEVQKLRDPQAGYARDFVQLMDCIAEESYNKKIGVLANAGGVNVIGCVEQLHEIAEAKQLHGYKIGYVLGDDLKKQIPDILAEGIELGNIDEVGDFEEIQDKIVNANVYFGHEPIVECLEQGANVVVTGRSTDSALFLSPLKYEFGWAADDWNNLARGIMVGHLLECGGQGAGGNFQYDWRGVPDMDQLGYPIAVVTENDTHITKAPNSGGIISEQSVKEQYLYEIHDPANYITPDVVVDASNGTLTQRGDNLVQLDNIKGKPRPDKLKLSIGYRAGYKVVNFLSYAWPDAHEKAQYAAEILMKRMKHQGLKAEEIHISYVGLNSLHLNVANMDPELIKNLNEVVLRIAIRTKTKEEAAKIVPEIAPMQLNGPPGSSFFGGRAKVQEIIGLWPTLIPREMVKLTSNILEVN